MNFIILTPKITTTKAKLRSIKAFDVVTSSDTSVDYLKSVGINKYLRSKGIKLH